MNTPNSTIRRRRLIRECLLISAVALTFAAFYAAIHTIAKH